LHDNYFASREILVLRSVAALKEECPLY